MIELRSQWKSVSDREKWTARRAAFVGKAKATKGVWFPPKPVETGKKAGSKAKKATTKSTRSATGAAKKTTGAARKSTNAAKKSTNGTRNVTRPVRARKG
jgi:hypothetical protein